MAASYRVRHQIVILGSIDADERLIGFQRTEKTVSEVIRTDLTEGKNESRSIGAAAVDENLEFGSVNPAKVLYIETDQALTIKINGGSDVFRLEPTSGSKAKLFWEGLFNQVQVTNLSATEIACVTYFVAG